MTVWEQRVSALLRWGKVNVENTPYKTSVIFLLKDHGLKDCGHEGMIVLHIDLSHEKVETVQYEAKVSDDTCGFTDSFRGAEILVLKKLKELLVNDSRFIEKKINQVDKRLEDGVNALDALGVHLHQAPQTDLGE